MATYYLLVGSMGAGKSTIREKFKNCTVVCPDDYRDELKVDVKTAYDMARKEIPKLLQDGKNVLLDATNAFPEKRIGMILVGKPYADKVVCVWLDTPVKNCIAQHNARLAKMRAEGKNTSRYEGHAEPFENIIKNYCDSINANPPTREEGFDEIIRITKNG